ncbi:transglycosylase SLT domain protein [Acinetobacter radioresistens WC-A-157]|nr:transglycosylase SLT domain protein [Acinetobacter radioresistens WC-A-157]
MYKPTTAVWQPSASILFKITLLGSAIAALGMTTGCSSTPANSKTIKSNQVGSGLLDASSLDSLEDLLSATDMRAVEGDRLLILKHGDVWKRMTVGFKMDLNHWDSRIEAQRSWFISRQPYLDRLSARASRYLYHTVKEAERRGLPTELALLPVIESSYDPAATSSAAAAGLWQFIPSTGKIYGLKQTSLYDGRRDVVESTRAAYEFLGSLYNQFGSWELALAAYNAGPGRIQQAINRNRAAGLPTDYWSLKLPQETMNYVPRFLAVAQIIKNPSAYGVSLPPIANRPHFREVNLNGGVGLNQVSSITGLSRAELYALNPGHRGEYVDPASPMRILIPADLSPAIDTKLRSLNSGSGGLWASNQPPVASKPASSVSVQTRVTPAASATVPSSSSSSAPVLASNSSKTTTAKVSTPKGSDALASFAAKADIPSAPRIPVAVTPAANITPVRVEPPISQTERDQILALVKAEGEKKSVEEVLQPQASQAEKDEVVAELKALAPQGTEIVDPYDGKIKLTAIQTSLSVAEQQGKEVKRGFSYPKAVAENTLANSEELERNKGKDYIKTDSEIVVIPPKGKRSTYTVQPGDTLAVIAMKNGVSWRDVAKWNQIDPSATLYVGTSLYLYDANPQKVERKNCKSQQAGNLPRQSQ